MTAENDAPVECEHGVFRHCPTCCCGGSDARRLRPAVPHGAAAHLHGDWLIDNDKCPFPSCPTRVTPPEEPLWEHRDGTPCPNTSDTWVCDEHGEQTRPIPPEVTAP
jgi:hypothetical protein